MRDAGCLPYVTGKSSLIGLVKTQFFYRESKTGGEMLKFSQRATPTLRREIRKFEVKAFLKTTTQ